MEIKMCIRGFSMRCLEVMKHHDNFFQTQIPTYISFHQI